MVCPLYLSGAKCSEVVIKSICSIQIMFFTYRVCYHLARSKEQSFWQRPGINFNNFSFQIWKSDMMPVYSILVLSSSTLCVKKVYLEYIDQEDGYFISFYVHCLWITPAQYNDKLNHYWQRIFKRLMNEICKSSPVLRTRKPQSF